MPTLRKGLANLKIAKKKGRLQSRSKPYSKVWEQDAFRIEQLDNKLER